MAYFISSNTLQQQNLVKLTSRPTMKLNCMHKKMKF